MIKTNKPTAWKFVWNDGRFFSSLSKQTIKNYAKGAIAAFGSNCGSIQPMYNNIPYIIEGRGGRDGV